MKSGIQVDTFQSQIIANLPDLNTNYPIKTVR